MLSLGWRGGEGAAGGGGGRRVSRGGLSHMVRSTLVGEDSLTCNGPCVSATCTLDSSFPDKFSNVVKNSICMKSWCLLGLACNPCELSSGGLVQGINIP